MLVLFISLALAALIYYLLSKHKSAVGFLQNLGFEFHSTNDEMLETMKMGLYYRFSKIAETEENPIDFERFVAKVMEGIYGGSAFVTKASGDFGVDVEHNRKEGVFLGQVKCYKDPLGYEPIALLHSQIIKQNASGGFVVTTSDFSAAAQKYAEGLGIDLIDGRSLVRLWLQTQTGRWEKVEPYIVEKMN